MGKTGLMYIAVTGHRPKSLGWGYDLKDIRYQKLFKFFYDYFLIKKATYYHLISGMALGVDTVFAFASIRFRDDYPNEYIMFEAAIPCVGQESKWSAKDRNIYKYLLKQANFKTIVSKGSYSPRLMNIRNEYMVDKSDLLFAVWNGEKRGGTYNCIKYAKKKGKDIETISPSEFE